MSSEYKEKDILEMEARLEAAKEQYNKDKEYKELLSAQTKALSYKKSIIENNNSNVEKAYQILIEEGVPSSIISIISKTTNITWDYTSQLKKLNDKDKLTIPVEKKIISTPYGDITNVGNDLKSKVPFRIQSQYRDYKISTIAKKILEERKSQEKQKEVKIEKENTKLELGKYFKSISPEGTTIEFNTDYVRRSRMGGGYDIDVIDIKYPNGSWVTIKYYASGQWSVLKKFDSKYNLPTEKEKLLQYLSK